MGTIKAGRPDFCNIFYHQRGKTAGERYCLRRYQAGAEGKMLSEKVLRDS